MYIELIEELNIGYSTEPSLELDETELTESEIDSTSQNLLYVPCEGIHSVITGNFTYYEPSCIKESVPLWTNPYGIPIIYHHKEHDGTIIGRVKKAEYISKSKRTGTPALGLLFGIGDEVGKQGVMNGTLSTVSIGAKALDLRCSICGHNIAKHGLCEHERGKKYEGKLCYWIVKKISPKEISYVIVPSDKYAYSEKPLTEEQVIAISESEDNEVNSLKNNLFSDMLSASLAESQEKKLQDEKKNKDNAGENNKAQNENEPKDEPKNEPESKPEENNKNEDSTNEQKEDNKESKPEENNETNKEVNEDKSDESKEDVKDEDNKNNEDDDEKNKEDNKKLEDTIKALQNKINDLVSEISTLKKQYEEEKKLRESAEKDKVLMESIMKKEYITKINDLRKDFGLAEKQEELQMKTSLDLLESEYNNLNEIRNSSLNCVNKISKIKSNTLIDEDLDNTSKPIKESVSNNKKQADLFEMKNRFYKR